jgi:hypothetical protein
VKALLAAVVLGLALAYGATLLPWPERAGCGTIGGFWYCYVVMR